MHLSSNAILFGRVIRKICKLIDWFIGFRGLGVRVLWRMEVIIMFVFIIILFIIVSEWYLLELFFIVILFIDC